MPSPRAGQEQQENRDNSPNQGLEGDMGSRGWPLGAGDTMWGHSRQPAAMAPMAGTTCRERTSAWRREAGLRPA